jgi:glutamine amidotransferase
MCRLFGMSAGSEPARATFWLVDAPDSLERQSYREPDGTGLGWFDAGGAPHISKQPRAAHSDATFVREAREKSSRTFVAHIRFATTGGLTALNTHPFEQDGRLFAHNGVIEDLPVLEAELDDAMNLVQGDTDSERFFALISREIAASGGDVGAGIATAGCWVAEHLPLLAINCVLVADDGLWALRYPETHELYVLERDAGSAMEHASRIGMRVRCEDACDRPVVVIASERMDDDAGWRLLGSGELLHASAQLEVTSQRVISAPPVHPLTLEDLGAQARAAQEPQHPPAAT